CITRPYNHDSPTRPSLTCTVPAVVPSLHHKPGPACRSKTGKYALPWKLAIAGGGPPLLSSAFTSRVLMSRTRYAGPSARARSGRSTTHASPTGIRICVSDDRVELYVCVMPVTPSNSGATPSAATPLRPTRPGAGGCQPQYTYSAANAWDRGRPARWHRAGRLDGPASRPRSHTSRLSVQVRLGVLGVLVVPRNHSSRPRRE